MSCYITALGTVTFGEYGFSAQTAIGLILSLGLVLYLIKRVVANFLKKLPVSGCNSPEPLLPNHKSIKYISTSSQRSWAHPVPTFSRKIPLSWHTRASQMAQCKESTCQCRRHKRLRFNPWVGKIPFVGNGNPLQYSQLGNPMDREVCWATVHGVSESQTRLSNWAHTHRHMHSWQTQSQNKDT